MCGVVCARFGEERRYVGLLVKDWKRISALLFVTDWERKEDKCGYW